MKANRPACRGQAGTASNQTTALLAACLALSSCIGPQSLDQPLSPLVVRSELVGRTVVGSENGQMVFIQFARNGIATRNGPAAEFGRWRIDENGALCLWWHDEPEHCALVYASSGSHYRWGDTDLSVLGGR
jgi:hypothetical protein